jgi:hypothetical protein
VIQQQSGKPIRQSADFPHRLIVSLRTTPSGEALLRENRSKLYGIGTLCSQRPLASECSLPNCCLNFLGNENAYEGGFEVGNLDTFKYKKQ